MTTGWSRALLATIACSVTLFANPCLANDRGYDVWFAGRVLSVDSQRGRLRIARGPIETAGRGVEDCIVAGADLTQVHPGMRIEAQADTRRRPWRVLHLRVMKLKKTQPHPATPEIAITSVRFASIPD